MVAPDELRAAKRNFLGEIKGLVVVDLCLGPARAHHVPRARAAPGPDADSAGGFPTATCDLQAASHLNVPAPVLVGERVSSQAS